MNQLVITRRTRGPILVAERHPAGGVLIDLECNRGKTEGARVRLTGDESELLRVWLAGEYVERGPCGQ